MRKDKVSLDAVIAAVQADDTQGFCTECGSEQDAVEPDARRYKCDECGKMAVYGAEELLLELGA